MKIIFLDVDGVLNWAGTEDRYPDKHGFIGLCSERIARLNKITDAHPDAKIVVSSTWRHAFTSKGYQTFEELIELLKERGVKGEIIGKTPSRFSYVSRGGEIREWIMDHEEEGGKLDAFVILDDSTEGMPGYVFERYDGKVNGEDAYSNQTMRDLTANHVVTHWTGDPNRDGEEGGLQDRHVELAIGVLNGNLVKGWPFV